MKNLLDTKNITIGADPEFFIVSKEGEAFPSTNLIKGNKETPEDMGNGYAIQRDNVLAEGNIPPAFNKEEYVNNMKNLKNIINEILAFGGYKLHCADSMNFKPKFLKHPEALEFGCSSYKNAWKSGNFAAENMAMFNARVAGAHQHIGYTLLTDKITKKMMNSFIAKAFDYFVIYPSRVHHNDPFRAKYYGEYGNYRDTSYGLEVRALGGYFNADKYLGWIYDQTIKTIEFCSVGDNLKILNVMGSPEFGDVNKHYETLNINLKEQLIND